MTPLPGTVNFPHIVQIFRIERDRKSCKSRKKSTEIAYGITSVPKDRGTPEKLLAWNRGHWSIENNNHRVRDVNFKEDACLSRTMHAPNNGAICNCIALAIIAAQQCPPCGTEGQLERSRSRTSPQDEPSQSFLCRSSLVAFPSLPDEKEFLQPEGGEI